MSKIEEYDVFSKGQTVERVIDGAWFSATIIFIDMILKTAAIRYLDDQNIENDVPFDEIRPCKQQITLKQNSESLPSSFVRLDLSELSIAGLVEDDSKIRSQHRPKVILHHDANSIDSIIINGSENELAAGGGVRALRYLKQQNVIEN